MNREYKKFEARSDLARIIACYTSGFHEALPEQDDYDLADRILKDVDKELSK